MPTKKAAKAATPMDAVTAARDVAARFAGMSEMLSQAAQGDVTEAERLMLDVGAMTARQIGMSWEAFAENLEGE